MPIRLNLLAEAQAAEEARRRDPVKRAIWIGAVLMSLMLAWSMSLQFKGMMAKRELARVSEEMNRYRGDYAKVQDTQKKVDDVSQKVNALKQLSESRFLQANLLNALQLTNTDDVQLVHLKTDQSYIPHEAVKAQTNANCVVPGKPATVTEKVVVNLEGSDSSPNPGEQVNKYKEAISGLPYVKDFLGKTNLVILKNQSQRQMLPSQGGIVGREGVLFTLECRAADRTR